MSEWMGIDPSAAQDYIRLLETSKGWYQETHARLVNAINAVRWDGQYAHRYRAELESDLGAALNVMLQNIETKRFEIASHLDRQIQLSNHGN